MDTDKSLQNEVKPDQSLPDITLSGQQADKSIAPDLQGKYFTVRPNGDAVIGDYAGGQGIFWDQSAGTLTILGGLTVSHLDIPDTVTANSFHTDTSGNSWWGSTALSTAIAKVSSTGAAVFKSISVINQITAGENVTAGKLLCLKNKFAAWGDDASADRNTTGTCTKMTYVSSDTGESATNFGSASLCYIGTKGAGSARTYFQLDTTMLPAWNELDTIFLRLYCVFADAGATGKIYLKMVTSAWAEGTVTWNTKPTDDGISWATGKVVVESFASETNAASADVTSTGYIDFDITEIYRLISQGTYTNNGFMLNTGGSCSNVRFGGRTRAGGGTFNQAPFALSYITKDNPGSGNTITANDGKVYLASNANYQRVKQLIGICGTTVSSGATTDVYSFTNGLIVPSSVLTVTNNQTYYLNDSSGGIGLLTNNILEHSKWDVKIGIGTPNGLVIEKSTLPLFIRSVSSPDSNGIATYPNVLPPPDCTMVKAVWAKSSTNILASGQLELVKGFLTSASSGGIGDVVATYYHGDLAWATGTAGLITMAINASEAGGNSFTLYFYK